MSNERLREWITEHDATLLPTWEGAGYRLHVPSSFKQYADALLQKKIRTRNAVLYFINVNVYGLRSGDRIKLTADCQFNTSSNKPTFDVELYRAMPPAETEAFFQKIYDTMGCDAYEGGGE
jgi:hypothetical protein